MAGAPTEHKWIFQATQLFNTPSRKAGIDAEKELNYRQQCANLIQDMGQRLQVTQLCINTAIVYMHRFYMFHSFAKFHRNPIASACLFLAAKVEEQPRKLEHVIKSYHICVNRDQGPLDVKSETYLEFAQELVCNENILLQTLGFDFTVEHPHQNVVKTCTLVKASKDLAQTSYFLATNSLHLTTMCLKYRHTVVACVCIHLACKWSNYQIPCSSEGKHWFQYVDKDVTLELLEDDLKITYALLEEATKDMLAELITVPKSLAKCKQKRGSTKLTQEFLNILENCPSKLKKKILTWKSGQRPPEDTANIPAAAGGPPDNNKKVKFDAPTELPAALPRHKQQHRDGGASGLRRVQTEPVLHKDHTGADRKDRGKQGPNHPPPHGGHHRQEIPGYHSKSSQPGAPGAPKGSWSSARPTHPPPPPKQRPTAAQASAGSSGNRAPQPPPSQPSSQSHERRSNIFEQMQSEHRTEPQRTSSSSNSSTNDPGSNAQFAIGTVPGQSKPGSVNKPVPPGHRVSQGDYTGSKKPQQGGEKPPHSNTKHPAGSKPGHHEGKPVGNSSKPGNVNSRPEEKMDTETSGLSTKEKILLAHAAKVEKEKERLAILSSPPGSNNATAIKTELSSASMSIKSEGVTVKESLLPGVKKESVHSAEAAAVSISRQLKQEQDMQSKLVAELKKQENYVKAKKMKLERERKERGSGGREAERGSGGRDTEGIKSPTDKQNRSPRLRSPPAPGRQKSDSTSSRSDSDAKTPSREEKHKMAQEHQHKIIEDRNRLRRMSEELGDPKIKQDAVVMLDNVFLSPDKGGHKPAELISPLSTSGGSSCTDKSKSVVPTTPVTNPDLSSSQGNTPTPNRTISLASYLKRKPLSQSQPGRTPQPNDMVPNPDKPTLAMEHLASIKLQGLKPLSEILKPTDIDSSPNKSKADLDGNSSATKSASATSKAVDGDRGSRTEAPSPKKPRLEKPPGKSGSTERRSGSGGTSLSRRTSSNTLTPSSAASESAASQQAAAEKHAGSSQKTPPVPALHGSQSMKQLSSGSAVQPPTLHPSHSAKDIPRIPSQGAQRRPTQPPQSSSSVPSGPKSTTPPQQQSFLSALGQQSSGTESPKEKKLSLKIKIGANPVVTMSPGTMETKEAAADPDPTKPAVKDAHRDKHKSERKKDKHRDKHRHDSKEHKSSKHSSKSSSSHQDSKSAGDLKMKLNIKGLKPTSVDSPFRIDNPNKSVPSGQPAQGVPSGQPPPSAASVGSALAAGDATGLAPGAAAPPAGAPVAPADGAAPITPMKLVIQKDKSGHYSSGHKHKHSKRDREHSNGGGEKSNRKRTHSPSVGGSSNSGAGKVGGTPVVPIKMPRNESSPSVGDVNGSDSPVMQHMHLLQTQQSLSKLIEKQKKNIKTTLLQEQERSRGNTPTQSHSPQFNK